MSASPPSPDVRRNSDDDGDHGGGDDSFDLGEAVAVAPLQLAPSAGLPVWMQPSMVTASHASEEEPVEQDDDDEEEEESPQLFPAFDQLTDRLRQSLYYGPSLASSADYNFLSLPVTRACVREFNRRDDQSEDDSEPPPFRLDQLDAEKAAEITSLTNGCTNPTSLVLALLYLERLRSCNPGYLNTLSSTDLFLVSLMVASKYLYDDGESNEVFNDDWASAAHADVTDLNKMELDFLGALDWSLYVSPKDFERTLNRLEESVVKEQLQLHGRNWNDGRTTYSDLVALSRDARRMRIAWSVLADCTIKMTALCAAAYTASLVTMLGSACLLNKATTSLASHWRAPPEATPLSAAAPSTSANQSDAFASQALDTVSTILEAADSSPWEGRLTADDNEAELIDGLGRQVLALAEQEFSGNPVPSHHSTSMQFPSLRLTDLWPPHLSLAWLRDTTFGEKKSAKRRLCDSESGFQILAGKGVGGVKYPIGYSEPLVICGLA